MKVFHLIDTIKAGGAENVAYNYARVLSDLNIKSVIVGSVDSHSYEEKLSGFAEIKHSFNIKKDINAGDVVFVHSNRNLIKLLVHWKYLRKKKNKVVYIQHLFYSEKKFYFLSKIINFVCSDFIQITPITSDFISKYIKIPTHFIVNFYINKYKKSEWSQIRNSVREVLGFSKDLKIVAFSAIFKPNKGVEFVVRLAEQMVHDKNYKFLVIGDGPEADYVRNYKHDNLLWIGRVDDVERYLIASDYYLFLSLFKKEMMPMALIEAINVEKNILALDTSINRFLLDGQTYKDLDHIYKALYLEKGKNGYRHYDREYAKKEITRLLNIDE